MEINGLFIRAEFRWHTVAAPSLWFYTSLPRASLVPLTRVCFSFEIRARSKFSFGKPAEVNRCENMSRSCCNSCMLSQRFLNEDNASGLWEYSIYSIVKDGNSASCLVQKGLKGLYVFWVLKISRIKLKMTSIRVSVWVQDCFDRVSRFWS